MSRAVILLSGGLDSTTSAAVARSEGHALYALTIDYNQRNRVELEAARSIAAFFRVEKHIILPVDLSLFGGSALTDAMAVEKDVPLNVIGQRVPSTYVPARNTVFLSLALAFAETVEAESIYIGANAVDFSGYPDCRPAYFEAFERLAVLATKTGLEEGTPISINTPLLHRSKAEIIRLGLSLGVDYSLTHTCYDPDVSGHACGRCEACILRRRGFEEVGLADPAYC